MVTLGCHPSSPSGWPASVPPAGHSSGHFLLPWPVPGPVGAGLPLQPMAQHAELWGRCTPAAALRFWGPGAAPRLCVLPGAPLTAAAKRKDRRRSNTPVLLHPSSPPHSTAHLSLRVCPPRGPGGPRGQASAFLRRVCLAGAVAGHRGSPAPGISAGRLSPVLTPHAQDPAVLSKAAPSGALAAGPLFYSCFSSTCFVFHKGLGSAS